MKCWSNSTCFVRSWWTGYFAMLVLDCLLHSTFTSFAILIFISCSNLLNHIPSQNSWAIALNSASALFWETTDFFLLCQVTRLDFPTHEHYPEVDLLSRTELAQPMSLYTSTSLFAVFLNINPLHGVNFRYLRMQYTASINPLHGVNFRHLRIHELVHYTNRWVEAFWATGRNNSNIKK